MSWIHRAALAASLAASACTVTTWTAMRANFPADAKLKVSCVEYPQTTQEFDVALRRANNEGWRVSALGLRVTSFLIFATHSTVACFEKEAGPSPTSAPAKPRKHAACQQEYERCPSEGRTDDECALELQRCNDAAE